MNGWWVRVVPLLALLLVSALWGSHPVVGKVVEGQLAPMDLTVWRFTFGAMCYLPFFGRIKKIFALPKRTFWQLALAGLCWAVLYPLLYYSSLPTLPATESLLLVNTSPLIAAFFAFIAFRERLRKWEWVGIFLCIVGVLVLLSQQWTVSGSWSGAVLALLAAAAFAGYTVSSKSLFQQLPLLDVLLGTSLWGAIDLWIVALVSGKALSVVTSLENLNRSGAFELVYIVLIVSTLAYALYGYGLKRLPAAVSSAVTFYPQVVFAALIEWVWIGLRPDWRLALSAALILAGTGVMRIKPKEPIKTTNGREPLVSPTANESVE